MKYWVFLLVSFYSFSQTPVDSISYAYFYKNELNEIVELKKQLKDEPNNLLKQIKLAEKYGDINCEDSSYATYFKAFEHNEKLKTLSQVDYFELILELHITETAKKDYTKNRGFFLQLLKKNIKNNLQLARFHHETAKQYFADSSDTKTAKIYFEKVKNNPEFSKNLLLQNKYYLSLGNLYTSEKQFKKAHEYITKSLEIATKNNDLLHQVFAHINMAVNYKMQKEWNEALTHLEIAEKIPNEKYKPKVLRIIYANKMQVFETLQNKQKLQEAELIYTKLDSIISDFQKNSNFYEIDAKYQLKEREEKYKTLAQKFYQNKMIYGFIIFIVFLTALYSLVRWKKVDAKKNKLVTEKEAVELLHTSTIEELEKIKQLVIEDHIVLKNKAKIYLNELIYIKSDDHYLELFTTHRKEFVRSKISELLKQLPPNFAQCHRSYIVNKNYILTITNTFIELKNKTEIPLSRNYKKNFKEV